MSSWVKCVSGLLNFEMLLSNVDWLEVGLDWERSLVSLVGVVVVVVTKALHCMVLLLLFGVAYQWLLMLYVLAEAKTSTKCGLYLPLWFESSWILVLLWRKIPTWIRATACLFDARLERLRVEMQVILVWLKRAKAIRSLLLVVLLIMLKVYKWNFLLRRPRVLIGMWWPLWVVNMFSTTLSSIIRLGSLVSSECRSFAYHIVFLAIQSMNELLIHMDYLIYKVLSMFKSPLTKVLRFL